MPRTYLHASMPGPSAAGGILGTLMGLVRLAIGLVFAVFFFFLLLFFGLIIAVLYLFGVRPKLPVMRMPNGFGFQGGTGPFGQPGAGAPEASATAQATPEEEADIPQQLESFHGSLDEFMEHRKGPRS
jgi:predicted lipid-binding transport protein (Tim44 family)